MATGSYMTPTYSRSQSEVQGDLHISLVSSLWFLIEEKDNLTRTQSVVYFRGPPIENYNEWRLLYFISFLLLVAFFVLNMFVGVVVENFHRCREQQELEEKARRAAKRAKKMDKKRRKAGVRRATVRNAKLRFL
ncbi:UNVERIFIED_CONTAM: Cacna1g [Trichonephila clavipes]